MKAITMVLNVGIAAGYSGNVGIGVSIPMRRAVGTIAAYDTSAAAGSQWLDPTKYTPRVVNENTIEITVATDGTDLAIGDIVVVYVEEVGDICRV